MTLKYGVYDRKTIRPELNNVFKGVFPGNVKFAFADKMGFGVKEQVYSTEENEKIDAAVHKRLE